MRHCDRTRRLQPLHSRPLHSRPLHSRPLAYRMLLAKLMLLSCVGFAAAADTQVRCEDGIWWGPSIAGHGSMLIAARNDEDVSWMALHLPGTVPFVVYNTQDNTTSHYAHVCIGNDAAAYLQFIVDYYDCLPEHMAFIHAQQMDVEISKEADLSLMKWASVPSFASLNRAGTRWHFAFPRHKRHINKSDYHHQAANGIMSAWEELLGSRLGPLPDELRVQAGGQFAVHQDRVLAHPRAFYQECLTWLANSTELSPGDKGMVFEYSWKLIFGETAESLDKNLWE